MTTRWNWRTSFNSPSGWVIDCSHIVLTTALCNPPSLVTRNIFRAHASGLVLPFPTWMTMTYDGEAVSILRSWWPCHRRFIIDFLILSLVQLRLSLIPEWPENSSPGSSAASSPNDPLPFETPHPLHRGQTPGPWYCYPLYSHIPTSARVYPSGKYLFSGTGVLDCWHHHGMSLGSITFSSVVVGYWRDPQVG